MTKGTKFKLPSASKAGMQKKQGRNFLLPKEKFKPKRNITQSHPQDFPSTGNSQTISKRYEFMPERQEKVPNKKYGPKPSSPSPSMRNILSPEEIRMLNSYRKKNKKKLANKKL